MAWGWYAAALIFALGDWYAVLTGRQRLRGLTKPAVMLVLIAGFWLAGGWHGSGFWFGLGLVFSLAGDVLLLLPPGFFIGGLAAFLLAHVCYIVGLNDSPPPLRWEVFAVLAILFGVDFFGYRRLRRAIFARPKGHWLRYPIFGYVVVISLMVFSAALTLFRPEWPGSAAVLVCLGAILFYCSDLVLANDRFVAPIRYGRLIVIVTYHLAQAAIVTGVLLL